MRQYVSSKLAADNSNANILAHDYRKVMIGMKLMCESFRLEIHYKLVTRDLREGLLCRGKLALHIGMEGGGGTISNRDPVNYSVPWGAVSV